MESMVGVVGGKLGSCNSEDLGFTRPFRDSPGVGGWQIGRFSLAAEGETLGELVRHGAKPVRESRNPSLRGLKPDISTKIRWTKGIAKETAKSFPIGFIR